MKTTASFRRGVQREKISRLFGLGGYEIFSIGVIRNWGNRLRVDEQGAGQRKSSGSAACLYSLTVEG